MRGKSCASVTRSGHWEKKEEADAVEKVTNYGDALLTETLRSVRTIQSHLFKVDDIIDESQYACLSGDIPVPRWTLTSSVA